MEQVLLSTQSSFSIGELLHNVLQLYDVSFEIARRLSGGLHNLEQNR